MKRSLAARLATLAGLLLAAALAGPAARAQEPPAPYSSAELDQLLGPIALYPDPLLSLILPAATTPAEVVSAASYLADHGDPNAAGRQPWSDSVKGLAHYPAVVDWMARNLLWVQALGAAFAAQPGDVMAAVQRLRARAVASGALVDTPQQHIVREDGLVEILPADADVLYVPTYDPGTVYLDGAYDGPPLAFGSPYPSGLWLSFGFDWRQRTLWTGPARFTHDSRGWQVPDLAGGGARRWQPAAGDRGAPARPAVIRPTLPRGGAAPFKSSTPAPLVRPGPAPLPRPVLPPAARVGVVPAGFRPANLPAGSAANSPLYSDFHGAPAPGRPVGAPTRAAEGFHPPSAPSAPGARQGEARVKPPAKPAGASAPPEKASRDADSTKR
jgi:hypothetical protein